MMSKSLAQKAAEKGININTVRARIRYGWSEHKALNTPVRQNKAEPESDPPKPLEPINLDKFGWVEDGFIITISALILGFAVVGILWSILR